MILLLSFVFSVLIFHRSNILEVPLLEQSSRPQICCGHPREHSHDICRSGKSRDGPSPNNCRNNVWIFTLMHSSVLCITQVTHGSRTSLCYHLQICVCVQQHAGPDCTYRGVSTDNSSTARVHTIFNARTQYPIIVDAAISSLKH